MIEKSKIKQFSFPKAEHLKKKSVIEQLFKKSRAVTVYPVRALFLLLPAHTEPLLTFPIKAGVSASKKHYPKAVQRNHLKRLLRESYRLQKHPIAQKIPTQQYLAVLFVYMGKEIKPNFEFVHKKMGQCLEKIAQTIEKT